MSNKKYAAEKPEDCSLCFFWKNARQGCSLGKENCYFIIFEPEKEKSDCDGCPLRTSTSLYWMVYKTDNA